MAMRTIAILITLIQKFCRETFGKMPVSGMKLDQVCGQGWSCYRDTSYTHQPKLKKCETVIMILGITRESSI